MYSSILHLQAQVAEALEQTYDRALELSEVSDLVEIEAKLGRLAQRMRSGVLATALDDANHNRTVYASLENPGRENPSRKSRFESGGELFEEK